MRRILLNKNKSVKNVNNDIIIPININRDYSLIQDEQKASKIDTFEVYKNEKNDSFTHRFIFTINPICTNVLFNYVTEIVYKEGSDECKILDDKESDISEFKKAVGIKNPTRHDAIKNTEYSNDIFNLKYHCGVDIFNNHLLRKKDDISIQPSTGVNKDFNTINDYCRKKDGTNIENIIPSSDASYTYAKSEPQIVKVYNTDTIDTFLNGFKNLIK